MTFRQFIYYCAVCGGWAAFAAWGATNVPAMNALNAYLKTILTGALLGTAVAAGIGWVDAVLNSKGFERILRVALCGCTGLVGGAVGGLVGHFLNSAVGIPAFVGWMVTGALIGASLGAFDVYQAITTGGDIRASRGKMLNGVYGGLLGGLLGGLPYSLLASSTVLTRSGSAIGLVALGACIGLMVGLTQVLLKEAWIKIEEGMRAGRELMLTKDEIVIGRAESCDLGLFGDNSIEKEHARINLVKNRYVLSHVGEGGETFVNDAPVGRGPVPLKAGDLIRVGRCVLSFGERAKKKK